MHRRLEEERWTERGSNGLALVDFLWDLRAELGCAQSEAQRSETGLRLGVEEIVVTPEVAHVNAISGEIGGKVSGRFLVLGSAERAEKPGRSGAGPAPRRSR